MRIIGLQLGLYSADQGEEEEVANDYVDEGTAVGKRSQQDDEVRDEYAPSQLDFKRVSAQHNH